jgi:pimeloyl-ACP methyl ester carboxylesterase
MLAASRSSSVDALVTVSGPGVTVAEQEMFRVRHQLPELGITGAQVAQASALLQRRIDRIVAGDDLASVHAGEAGATSEPWAESLGDMTLEDLTFVAGIYGYDPVESLRTLHCPLLAIWGGADTLVPVVESVSRFLATLPSDHSAAELMIIPNAEHALRIRGIPGRAPGLWPSIAGWVKRCAV